MQAFELSELLQQHAQADKLYLEFLRVPDLSVGLYVLPDGGIDPQTPHNEEEVYCVLSGRGKVQVGAETQEVKAGSIIYVAKGMEHHFHSIEEELHALVFFAPAEYSRTAR